MLIEWTNNYKKNIDNTDSCCIEAYSIKLGVIKLESVYKRIAKSLDNSAKGILVFLLN